MPCSIKITLRFKATSYKAKIEENNWASTSLPQFSMFITEVHNYFKTNFWLDESTSSFSSAYYSIFQPNKENIRRSPVWDLGKDIDNDDTIITPLVLKPGQKRREGYRNPFAIQKVVSTTIFKKTLRSLKTVKSNCPKHFLAQKRWPYCLALNAACPKPPYKDSSFWAEGWRLCRAEGTTLDRVSISRCSRLAVFGRDLIFTSSQESRYKRVFFQLFWVKALDGVSLKAILVTLVLFCRVSELLDLKKNPNSLATKRRVMWSMPNRRRE